MVAPPATATGSGATLSRLFAAPHRFFFLVGVIEIALAALWWVWVQASRAWPAVVAPGSAVPDPVLHALLMTCGFAPFFMFGFLFTAGPRWLDMPAPEASEWRAAGIVAAVSALALVPLQVIGADAMALRVAAALYAAGWIWLAGRFLRLIRASDAPDRVHAKLVLAALSAGASCVAAFALFGGAAHAWVGVVGVWCFLIPVFVTVCHRMIPFFTSGVLPFVTAFRPWWLLVVMAAAPVLHAALAGARLDPWTWVVDLPAGLLLLWVTIRWGFVQGMKNHLLAMLHLGFVWYGLGLVLAGASSLDVLSGGAGLGLAPLHALTIGFASSLLMAMVTRVTCGHSGRTLAADVATWRLFQLLQVAAVVRVAAEILPARGELFAAALVFAAAFVPWCAKYAPVYWRPRADGRSG